MAPFLEVEAHRTTPKQGLSMVATIGEGKWLAPGQEIEHGGLRIQVSSDQLIVDTKKVGEKEIFTVPQGKWDYYSSTWLHKDRNQVTPGQSLNMGSEHRLLIFPKGSAWGTMFKWLSEEQKAQDESFRRRFPLTDRFGRTIQYFKDRHLAVALDWHNKPISLRKVWETVIPYFVMPAATVLILPVLVVESVTVQPAILLYDKLARKSSLANSSK